MSITKPKISSLVSGQLPEFIQEDYQTFVAFLEAYYEYLEQNILVDYDTISDIDTTYDSFVQYFKNELALNFPSLSVDDKFLLPKLKQLYTAKGTEASYRLLFRLLYNKEIEINYPSQQMLRVSDGKWVQDTSIFVQLSIGDKDLIVGKTVTISTSNKKIKVFIDRYVATTNPTIYEFFITGGWTGDFNAGSIVSYGSSFFGTIVSTTKSISIIQPGKNFKVGEIYQLTGSGTGSCLIVLKTNSTGGIVTAKLLTFGTGYASDYSTSFLSQSSSVVSQNYFSKSTISSTVTPTVSGTSGTNTVTVSSATGILIGMTVSGTGIASGAVVLYKYGTTIILSANNTGAVSGTGTFSYVGSSLSLGDSITQLADYGSINKYDYAVTNFDIWTDASYAGPIVASFSNTSTSATANQNEYAIIGVQLGSYAKYPGYYKNDDGFLDSTKYIQDSRFYQAFSYVIKVDELFESYRSIVKNLLHPAGTELFGEHVITNVFDIGTTTQSVITINNLITENLNRITTESGVYLITE